MTICHYNINDTMSQGGIMAKKTFYNLPKEKKENILSSLKEIFEQKEVTDVTVSEIVQKLNLARGSFYQYFEDIYDAYFEVMDKYTLKIHEAFFEIFKKNKGNLEITLKLYGDFLVNILYDSNVKNLYRYKFLNWNEKTNNHYSYENMNLKSNFIKAILHELIKDSFRYDYTRELFITTYNKYCIWILKGVKYE